jgi:hypothetical protein
LSNQIQKNRMSNQFIFKDKYVQKLKDDLNVAFYKSNQFVFDQRQVLQLPNIERTQDLGERLIQNVNNDCDNAIIIYEAFQKLELIQASDVRLWVYLSHADLYSYMVKRWDNVITNVASDEKKYILDHWFLSSSAQNNLMRHGIAGLWWSVYLSIDEGRSDKYELTRILFRQLDFPTRTLGIYKLGRHKEAVIGILEFIKENDGLFKNKFQDKTRFMTEHLNFVGGVKPISYYDRAFFKAELEKVAADISVV